MEELETRLRQLQKKAGISVGGLMLSIVLAIVLFLLAGALGFLGIAAAVVFGIFAARNSKRYTTYYKENVVKAALAEVFTDMTFEPKFGISREVVASTRMIQMGNRYSANDLITGKYHEVAFTQSDVCIEDETTDSKGNTSTTTLFKGRWMIFEFNKEFRCDLQVISKHFFSSRRKGGLFTKKEERLHKVEFEDEAFNKEFKVYAQDEQEAFYLLTPQIMQALMALRAGMRAPIMLMFVGGRLHIAVYNGKDAFEAKLFGKLDLSQEKARILADTRVITDFVDGMAMDRDLYKY